MADQIQLRGGTTAETQTFTGANREVTIDTDKKVLVVHDGVQPGGYPLQSEGATTDPLSASNNLSDVADPAAAFNNIAQAFFDVIEVSGSNLYIKAPNGDRIVRINNSGLVSFAEGFSTAQGPF